MSKFLDKAAGTNAFWYLLGGLAALGAVGYLVSGVKKEIDDTKKEIAAAIGKAKDTIAASPTIVGNAVIATAKEAVTNPAPIAAAAIYGPVGLIFGGARFIGDTLFNKVFGKFEYEATPPFPEQFGLKYRDDGRLVMLSVSEPAIIATAQLLDLYGYVFTIGADGVVQTLRRVS